MTADKDKTYKSSKDDSQVVADIVDVLLGLNELVEGYDTISREESMVGSSVEPGHQHDPNIQGQKPTLGMDHGKLQQVGPGTRDQCHQ